MRNVAEKVVEKIKTHLICSTSFFSKNLAFYEIIVEKYGAVTQTTDDNIIRRMRIACRIRKTTDFFKGQSNLIVVVSNELAINPVKVQQFILLYLYL